jgi:hypothetical protein
MAENGNNEDTSEVSLIAVDNEDQHENVDENDGESVDENNATQEMIDSEKSSKIINILIYQLQICIYLKAFNLNQIIFLMSSFLFMAIRLQLIITNNYFNQLAFKILSKCY